jgi:hypothetical protein
MKNKQIFVKDPTENWLRNNGCATVSDAASLEERRTLRSELETFVCDGEYANGLERILRSFLDNLNGPGRTEQQGFWISGFFGSGKSHLLKMLHALWSDFSFPEDGATARGLVKVPPTVAELLVELDGAKRREGGIHAASGTLGAGAGDSVRLALLEIVFRSVGLSDQYPLARFELWLKELGYLEAVRGAVQAEGRDWHGELRSLYGSPLIAKALLDVYPDLAASPMEVRQLLREQFPNVQDVSNQQMVEAIRDALTKDGQFPLTLIGLDEIQQYIWERPERSYPVQEAVETCCKKFGTRVLFVGTGQTALSGTAYLEKLMGRFTLPIELSEADINTVIRQVILAKKPDAMAIIDEAINSNLGEISRHLTGTKVEHRPEDLADLNADYPILPVRRRFWEHTLRAVDQGGTALQLRSQLRIVRSAVVKTADEPVGTVVAGDFIYEEIAANLLQSGVLSGEIYDYVRALQNGSADDQLKARLCALVYLVGKLPREAGADIGLRATPSTLADLLVQDLQAGSEKLRRDIQPMLEQLEDGGKVIRVGDEFRLQTREGSAWNDEYRSQMSRILQSPPRLVRERIDLLRAECAERLKNLRLRQGRCNESRRALVHFGTEAPPDLGKSVQVWFRDGWQEDEKAVLADARAAGNLSPTIFVHVPAQSSDDIGKTIASLRAATATLEARGIPGTPDGEEARAAIKTVESTAAQRLKMLLDELYSAARVFQGGGQEVNGQNLLDSVQAAAESSLIRLYRKFDEADHTGWSKVIDRARQGSETPLEAVDFQGDIDKHPVTSTILNLVAVGKRGSEIRARLEDSEYGWPRDAIDGGIYALLATGNLRATDPTGRIVDARSLDRAKINQSNFRIESTTVTTVQRIQIRKLLTDLGISTSSGDELAAMPELFRTMRELANSAGGLAPRPQTPSTVDLEEVAQLPGNEQLVAVHARREEILNWATNWRRTSHVIEERMAKWHTLEALLNEAGSLVDVSNPQAQADAILEGRLLLADPDPMPGLIDHVAQLLRTALITSRDAYSVAFDRGVERLQEDSNWSLLDENSQSKLLLKYQITEVPEIGTGTTQEVLTALRSMSLHAWQDRTAALPARVDSLLRESAELALPSPVFLKVQGATILSADDVEPWLEAVGEQVRRAVEAADGAPLVIS